ncbi:hypothetical protein [Streptomyces lunaelactis]|nr:hypothetical protein [Streptomyces lunaelactis]
MPVRAADDDESGRCLALLEAVTVRWGVVRGADSRTLWCELGDA